MSDDTIRNPPVSPLNDPAPIAASAEPTCDTGLCGNEFHIHDCPTQTAEPTTNDALADALERIALSFDEAIDRGGSPVKWEIAKTIRRAAAALRAQAAAPLTDDEIEAEAAKLYDGYDDWMREKACWKRGARWARDRSAHAAPSRDSVEAAIANVRGYYGWYKPADSGGIETLIRDIADAIMALYDTEKPETP